MGYKYPIKTIHLNLNFRQNQARIWKVHMTLTLLKKKKIILFQLVNSKKPHANWVTCTPLRQFFESVCLH